MEAKICKKTAQETFADEAWLYYYDLTIKQQSSDWKHPSSPTLKKSKTVKSTGLSPIVRGQVLVVTNSGPAWRWYEFSSWYHLQLDLMHVKSVETQSPHVSAVTAVWRVEDRLRFEIKLWQLQNNCLVQRKRRILSRVRCKNIKNDCPKPGCEDPVLLPQRCCKTCPGEEIPRLTQTHIYAILKSRRFVLFFSISETEMESVKELDEIGNMIEAIDYLSWQVNSIMHSDVIQELLDSHNQELTMDELTEMLE
ncbi:uncharacterized protein TNCV_789371 [Trichonephila clavipes]|nr:uncharacterized protein TNCV_789371 [Trichonephila clavipes]